MGQLEDLQAKGFGSHGGKTYEVHNDIKPLKKRVLVSDCLLYTSPSPRDVEESRMPSSA